LSHARGARAEQLAATFLAQRGLQVLTRNYRCRYGEIDLIVRDGEILCFVEVRARSDAAFSPAIATIRDVKRRRILKAAAHFLAYAWRGGKCACRFDVVTVEGTDSPITEWWRGAFEADAEGNSG
jgi:putative endonuclease